MRHPFLKLFSLLLISIITLMLTSCGPIYSTTYTYQPPTSWTGRQCVNECLLVKSHCQSRCQRNYQRCVFQAQETARIQYREYRRTHHHHHHHDDDILGPDYFVDTSQCDNSCGCGGDYNQ